MTNIQIDLFGNKTISTAGFSQKKEGKNSFDDYEGFVEKFKPKKTTDDCYTPSGVYECVLSWVRENADIEGCKILRPFYPGGDYQNVDYSGNCVVIDNPPFSIISEIVRFYVSSGVRFFLFAPHLTLFTSDIEVTALVVGTSVVYGNGANVKTSFLSNLFGDIRVMGVPDLYRKLESINDARKANLPKYAYPPNVLTVSMVHKWVSAGIPVRFDNKMLRHCRGLDAQKERGKAIFGSGFLISNRAAAEKAALEKTAQEKAAQEKGNGIKWELSDSERAIINSLE